MKTRNIRIVHVSKQLQPIWQKKTIFYFTTREKKRRESIIEYLPFDQVSHNLGIVFLFSYWKLSLISLNLLLVTFTFIIISCAGHFLSCCCLFSMESHCINYLQHRLFNRNHTEIDITKTFFFFSAFPIHLFIHRSSLTLPFVIFSMTVNWNQLLVGNWNGKQSSEDFYLNLILKLRFQPG